MTLESSLKNRVKKLEKAKNVNQPEAFKPDGIILIGIDPKTMKESCRREIPIHRPAKNNENI